MTHESSAHLMDQIFSSGDEEAKTRLLKILQDFLSSESAKHSAQEKGTYSPLLLMAPNKVSAAYANKKAAKGVDMEAFVGNTHGFAESGYVYLTSSICFLTAFAVSAPRSFNGICRKS